MAEKTHKSYRVVNVIGSSFIKRLSNADHAHFMMEFLQGLPQGIYDNKRALLTQMVSDEIENINNCRKNHNREVYNSKVATLKSTMFALYRILLAEAKTGNEAASREVHSYEIRVRPELNNKGYVEAVTGFLHAWSGTESRSSEALVEEARELLETIHNTLTFMMMEDLMIKNINAQIVLRENTDAFVFNIIAKASVESFELNPDIPNEEERLEQINEFLAAWIGLVERIRISVKNSGGDGGDEPEPELAPSGDANMPSMGVQESSDSSKMGRSIREMVLGNIIKEDQSKRAQSNSSLNDSAEAQSQRLRAQQMDAQEIADQVLKNVVAKYGENLSDEELEKYSQEEYAALTADDEE